MMLQKTKRPRATPRRSSRVTRGQFLPATGVRTCPAYMARMLPLDFLRVKLWGGPLLDDRPHPSLRVHDANLPGSPGVDRVARLCQGLLGGFRQLFHNTPRVSPAKVSPSEHRQFGSSGGPVTLPCGVSYAP